MSKKDKVRKSDAREPWEQSIYEPENDTGHSRVEKRQNKKGNTVFLTILVILLVLIIALPTGTFFWMMRDKSNDANKSVKTASSSLVQSTTKSSNADSQVTSESQTSDSQTDESGIPDSGDEQQQEAGQAYDTVLKGEGFQQIAERNGITIAELERLNNMSSSTIIQPGDQLRVK